MKRLRGAVLLLVLIPSALLWGHWLYVRLDLAFTYFRYLLFPGSLPASSIDSDVLTFWGVGHLFLRSFSDPRFDPGWIYNMAEFHHHAAVPGTIAFFFVYPPYTVWLTAILGPFSYAAAFALWRALMVIPAILLLAHAGMPKVVIGIGLLGPAVMASIGYGQFDTFTAALYISGLLAIGEKPAHSGILLGLLAIKPQNGLLGPIALLARGQIRALLWGAATVAVLCVSITLVMGRSVWLAFFRYAPAMMHNIVNAPFPTNWELRGTSVFWLARSLGGSLALAGWIQAGAALAATVVCFLAWRRRDTDRVALVTLTTILTVFMSPYGLLYDLSAVSIMTGWLAWRRGRITLVDGLVWIWPVYCQLVSTIAGIEATPLVLLLGTIQAWRELSPAPAATGHAAAAIA